MRQFLSPELQRMRGEQINNMQDTCFILTYSEVFDDYHSPTQTFVTGSSQACNFNPTISDERRVPEMIRNQAEAELRLPLGTALTQQDKIRIYSRYDATGSVGVIEDFDIAGDPIVRATCLFAYLMRVEA